MLMLFEKIIFLGQCYDTTFLKHLNGKYEYTTFVHIKYNKEYVENMHSWIIIQHHH